MPLNSKLTEQEAKALALLCERTAETDPRRAIVRRAEQLVQDFGGNSPTTPAALAQAQHIVEIARLDLTFDACLVPVPRGFRVELCRFHSPARQNFSIAHEIGHTFLIELNPALRSPKRERDLGSESGTDLIEQLCDQAAAELLWPATRFRREMWELGASLRSVLELAARYKTSIIATARRFAEIGLWKCHFVLWEIVPNEQETPVLRPRVVYRSPFVTPIYKQDLLLNSNSLSQQALHTKDIIRGREPVTVDGERCYTESVRLGNGENAQVLSLLLIEPHAEYLARRKRSQPQLKLFST